MLPPGDTELVQIVDCALADATARGGDWLACRPGCNQCCTGVFRISALDAERLRQGLRALMHTDPERARRIRERVTVSAQRLSAEFPGNTETGLLFEDDSSKELFEEFANDELCPVLDPGRGTCDLYTARPLTCRTFGPPVRTEEDGFGICELCFVDAPEEAVAAAEMHLPSPELEYRLINESGWAGETIVTFAL